MNPRFLALILGWLVITGSLTAQIAGKEGSDPTACAKYQSHYQDLFQQGDFKGAMPWWILAQKTCPEYSKNLYVQGVKMFEDKIDKEPDPRRKNILIDSLLWVYECRIKYFGDDIWSPKGYVLGLKGISIQKYRRQDYQKGYAVLGESITLMGVQSSAAVVITYMQASQQLFKDGLIDTLKVLADFKTSMGIIETHLEKNPGDLSFSLVRDQVNAYFIGSGAANCLTIKELYADQLPDLKTDVEWLRQVTLQLKKTGCTGSDLFLKVSEALFKIEPAAEIAYDIGRAYEFRNENSKAAEYLQKAIELGKKTDQAADFYYELGNLNYLKLKNYEKARSLALKAIESRPNWGKPYLLIGQIYADAHGEVFSDPWKQSTVLWVAVDKFIKAKSVDPEVAEEANKLITKISDNFPAPEVVASRSLRDGDTYTVGGWIKETTRVRSKKS